MEVLLEKTSKTDQRIAMESVEKLKKASKSGKSIQINGKPLFLSWIVHVPAYNSHSM